MIFFSFSISALYGVILIGRDSSGSRTSPQGTRFQTCKRNDRQKERNKERKKKKSQKERRATGRLGNWVTRLALHAGLPYLQWRGWEGGEDGRRRKVAVCLYSPVHPGHLPAQLSHSVQLGILALTFHAHLTHLTDGCIHSSGWLKEVNDSRDLGIQPNRSPSFRPFIRKWSSYFSTGSFALVTLFLIGISSTWSAPTWHFSCLIDTLFFFFYFPSFEIFLWIFKQNEETRVDITYGDTQPQPRPTMNS